MASKPSEKQVKYAKDIAGLLNLDLPKEYSAKAYYDFIADHKYAFDSYRQDCTDASFGDDGFDPLQD